MGDAWQRLARLRDARTGETGDLWHRALIDPAVRRVVGAVRGLAVLEIACGNGYLAREFAARGAADAVGIDRSSASIRYARARERTRRTGARFRTADATDLPFARASFDLVVANMGLMDIGDARGAIREAARVLRPDGRLVFSISHPCFDLDDRSAWSVEHGVDERGFFDHRVYRKVRGYRDERRARTPWRLGPRSLVWTESYHRTLATYSRYLRDAGLGIRRLEEPAPHPEMLRDSPQGPYLLEIPLHLVVEAVRLPPTRRGSRTTGRNRAAVARRSGSGDRSGRTGSGRPGSRTEG